MTTRADGGSHGMMTKDECEKIPNNGTWSESECTGVVNLRYGRGNGLPPAGLTPLPHQAVLRDWL